MSVRSQRLAKTLVSTIQDPLIFETSAQTAGHHGYGDVKEVAAKDPKKLLKWEPTPNLLVLEPFLAGRSLELYVRDGGSYHEKWVKVYVTMSMDEDLDDKLSETSYSWERVGYTGKHTKKIGVFQANSVSEFLAKVKSYVLDGLKPLDNLASSEETWNRDISKTQMGKPTFRNWDGD